MSTNKIKPSAAEVQLAIDITNSMNLLRDLSTDILNKGISVKSSSGMEPQVFVDEVGTILGNLAKDIAALRVLSDL